MSDKISPAQKPVPAKEGFNSPASHGTISTPVDNEGNVWTNEEKAGNSIFHKPVVH